MATPNFYDNNNSRMMAIYRGEMFYWNIDDFYNAEYLMTGFTFIGSPNSLSNFLNDANSYANSLNTQINNLQFVSAISQDADSSAILNQLNNAAAYAAIAEGLTRELDSSVVNINNITNELRAINNSVVNTVPVQYAVNNQATAIIAFNNIRAYVDNGASLVTSTTMAYNTLEDIVKNYYSKLTSIQQNVDTATAIQRNEVGMAPNEIRRRKSSVNGRDYIDKIPLVGTLQLPYQPLIGNSHDVATVAEINANLPLNQQKKI